MPLYHLTLLSLLSLSLSQLRLQRRSSSRSEREREHEARGVASHSSRSPRCCRRTGDRRKFRSYHRLRLAPEESRRWQPRSARQPTCCLCSGASVRGTRSARVRGQRRESDKQVVRTRISNEATDNSLPLVPLLASLVLVCASRRPDRLPTLESGEQDAGQTGSVIRGSTMSAKAGQRQTKRQTEGEKTLQNELISPLLLLLSSSARLSGDESEKTTATLTDLLSGKKANSSLSPAKDGATRTKGEQNQMTLKLQRVFQFRIHYFIH